jgi:uncharacterized protein (DUF1778 family)
MASPTPLRETTINLRAQVAEKALIDRAAELLGQSRSSFMLEASVQRAQTVLADQTHFVLDEAQWAAFNAALDAPLPNPDAVRRLLALAAVRETER